MKDTLNDESCLVAYVGIPGTAPSIDCYKNRKSATDDLVRNWHLREGDLYIHRVVDKDSTKTCLIACVSTGGTLPSLKCYNSNREARVDCCRAASCGKVI